MKRAASTPNPFDLNELLGTIDRCLLDFQGEPRIRVRPGPQRGLSAGW
jgi:hypothetical protein